MIYLYSWSADGGRNFAPDSFLEWGRPMEQLALVLIIILLIIMERKKK